MSTRATYQFQNACIYIHHDGYEAGAANYFHAAIVAGKGSLTAESMIRANDRAEITSSHELHGDTDYRYTVTSSTLKVESRVDDKWRVIYNGDLVDFINAHRDESLPELRRVDFNHQKMTATPAMVEELIDERSRLLGIWASKGHQNSFNFKSVAEEVGSLRAMLTFSGNWA